MYLQGLKFIWIFFSSVYLLSVSVVVPEPHHFDGAGAATDPFSRGGAGAASKFLTWSRSRIVMMNRCGSFCLKMSHFGYEKSIFLHKFQTVNLPY
jgi:hypothetical protein